LLSKNQMGSNFFFVNQMGSNLCYKVNQRTKSPDQLMGFSQALVCHAPENRPPNLNFKAKISGLNSQRHLQQASYLQPVKPWALLSASSLPPSYVVFRDGNSGTDI
jgi:hypothetical protein